MKTINGIEIQDWEVVDTDKVAKVAEFIIDWINANQHRLFNRTIQLFNSRNICGDYMENILVDTKMKIMIDFSDNGYMEVFGATESEFKIICDWCKMLGYMN